MKCQWIWVMVAAMTLSMNAAAQDTPSPFLQDLGSSRSSSDGIGLLPAAPGPARTETDYLRAVMPQLRTAPRPAMAVTARDVTTAEAGLAGRIAHPAATSPTTALLLIPGVTGLTDGLREEIEALARLGAAVLVVDLYGRPIENRREAFQAWRELDRAQTVTRVAQAREWLAGQFGLEPTAVGLVGFGLAADLLIDARLQEPAPVATIVFYGGLNWTEEQVAGIRSPVLGFYSRRDPSQSKERVDAFEERLRAAGVEVQTFLYTVSPDFQTEPQTQQDRSYAQTVRDRIIRQVTPDSGPVPN